MIATKTIGKNEPYLHRISYSPGKWTCAVACKVFGGESTNPDSRQVQLPSVGFGWVHVRDEYENDGEGIGILYKIYETASEIVSHSGIGPGQNSLWSADVHLELCPISLHKNFGELKNKYKARLNDGEWDWPAYDPTGESTRTGTDKTGKTIYGINPMYGVQEFLLPTVTVQKTTPNAGSYSNISGDVGYVDSPPDGPVPFPRGGGNQLSGAAANDPWIKSSDSYEVHGRDHLSTEAWTYSPHGWNRIIYSS
jgi:hypothetical protein